MAAAPAELMIKEPVDDDAGVPAVIHYPDRRNPFDFIVGPKAPLFREARERDLAAGRVRTNQSPESTNWLNLGTHPDLVERLWRQITASLRERHTHVCATNRRARARTRSGCRRTDEV
jgi:hypothetical protein